MVMKPKSDDDIITSVLMPKRVRRKLGSLVNGNESLGVGLERILDDILTKK